MIVIHQEVITHEHVVSMMKAAIRDTQDQPMFVSLSAPFSPKGFQGWFRAQPALNRFQVQNLRWAKQGPELQSDDATHRNIDGRDCRPADFRH